MNLESFSTGNSFLHRLDARVKILSSLALLVVIALCRTFPTATVGLGIAILLVLAARLKFKKVLTRLILVNSFVAFLWITLPLSYPGATAFSFGPLDFSHQGIRLAALISVKTNGSILIMISLLATSTVAALGHGLTQLKVPTKLCLLLLFSYRYIFVIHQEYQRLVRAARLRCFRAGSNVHTWRTTGYLFGMTLIKSHHRAMRVRQAMLLRGFRGQFHSIFEATIGRSEVWFFMLIMALVTGLISVELLNL